MEDSKQYSIWFVPSNRWTNCWCPVKNSYQSPKAPFKLTYDQCVEWLKGELLYGNTEFIIKEIPTYDYQRRLEHAMKYL